MSRVLRLTLLAPEIVEAMLDGRQSAELQLDDLLGRFPLDWVLQSKRLAVRGQRRQQWFRGCPSLHTCGPSGHRINFILIDALEPREDRSGRSVSTTLHSVSDEAPSHTGFVHSQARIMFAA